MEFELGSFLHLGGGKLIWQPQLVFKLILPHNLVWEHVIIWREKGRGEFEGESLKKFKIKNCLYTMIN